MSEKGMAFHRQYVRIFPSTFEVHDFVNRNAEKPWFEVNSVNMRMVPVGTYAIERYVVLYTAQEPLS